MVRIATSDWLRKKYLAEALKRTPVCSECRKVKLVHKKWRELGMCAKCYGLARRNS